MVNTMIPTRPIFTPILVSLTTLAIYLAKDPLFTHRVSPPIFLIISLGLIIAAYQPNLKIALISIISIVFINILFAIDYIHGECWYEVLIGGESWHKSRLGDLGWYKQCIQPSQGWWIMWTIGLIWLFIGILEVTRNSQDGYQRIRSNDEEEGGEERD